VNPYLAVLRAPSVALLLVSQLVARLPAGMVTIALLLHVEQSTGSYANAGVVVAVLSVGQAAAGPVGGRAAGRWGPRAVLIVTTVTTSCSLAAVAVLPELVSRPPFAAFVLLALVAGASMPPVQPTARTIYPTLVAPERVASVLALDASLQEVIFVVAPVAAAFAAAAAGGAAAVLLTAAVALVGGMWFALSGPVRRATIPRGGRAVGRVLLHPAVWPAVLVGLLLVAGSAAVEVAVVAAFASEPPLSGALLAVYSVSSLIGGLVFGVLSVRRWSLVRSLLVVAVGLALSGAVADFWWIGAALFLAGLGVAPVFALTYANVSTGVGPAESAEAFGWVGTGALIGAAAGAAVAGAVVESAGAHGAFAVAASFVVLAVILTTALTVRDAQRLRQRVGPL